MLSKLIKYDFKKIFGQVFVFFVLSIVLAGISRGFNELGKSLGFFKVVGIFFTSVEYAIMANVIIQPIVRILAEFGKNMYGDASYLTHTIPAKRSDVFLSKCLSALLIMLIAFVSLIVSVAILALSKDNIEVLKVLISGLLAGSSLNWVAFVVLFVFILFAEFLSLISIVFCAIVCANKFNENKVVRGFALTIIFQFLQMIAILLMFVVATLITGDLSSLFTATPQIGSSLFVVISIVGVIGYLLSTIAFYFVSQHLLSKGVDVN